MVEQHRTYQENIMCKEFEKMVTNGLCFLISALAFIFGGCLGFFICAVMSANRSDEE